MRLHRFYLDSIPEVDQFPITDERLVHQIKSVLRYKEGEKCIVFSNGTDDHIVSIDDLRNHEILVHKTVIIPAKLLPPRRIIAAVSIIKKDLFELVVQKLTELGVETIVPIISDRTVKQDVRLDRLALISKESVEQSGRNTLVDIKEPMTLQTSLESFPYPSVVFDTEHSDTTPVSEKTIVLYIGPEGGWSDADRELFRKHNTVSRTLGPNTLRAETAAIIGTYELLWH